VARFVDGKQNLSANKKKRKRERRRRKRGGVGVKAEGTKNKGVKRARGGASVGQGRNHGRTKVIDLVNDDLEIVISKGEKV